MTKTCAYCNAPITRQHPLCRLCAQRQRHARQRAAQLTDDQKRAIARAAVQSLREHGRVKVRFLQVRKV